MNKINKRRLKILIVTSDKKLFEMISRLTADLDEKRVELDWKKSERAALLKLKADEPDVCLIDNCFKKKSGLDFLHKAILAGCRRPMILLTAETDERFRLEAIRLGATCCLEKAKIDVPLFEQAIGYAVERVNTLTELRDDVVKFRTLIETLPVMIYTVEPHPPYSVIYISPTFEKFGYPLKQWKENADFWVCLLHPEDRRKILAETEKAMKENRETDFEYRIIAQDGRINWVHDCGRFVYDNDGKAVCWQGVIIDITERKLAEEELQKREKLYRTLVRSLPNTGVLIFDKELRYSIAEVGNVESYQFSREMIEGKTIWEVFSPDVALEWADYYRRALAGETVSLEIERGKNFFQTYTVPVKNEFGKTFAGMILWQDITERKRSEKALRESAAQFKSTFEDAAVGMAISSLDGRWLQVNQRLCEMLGYSKEELINHRFSEVMHPDDFKDDFESSEHFLFDETPIFQREKRFIHKSGKVVWGYLNISRINDDYNKPSHFIAEIQDITARKQAVEALCESEARYRDIYENANDLIYIHDLDGNYLSINKATERVIGYTLEEALKLNMRDVVAPEDLKFSRFRLKDKLAGSEQTIYETDCITKDGRRVTLEVNSSAIYKNGEVVAVQGIARDITERKQSELRLQQSEAQMHAVFSSMTDTVMVFDSDGRNLKISQSNPKLLYKPAINLFGKTIHEIFPKTLADYFSESIHRSLETRKSVKMEYRLKTGGEECWFAAVVSPMLKHSVVIVARDISENKRAEKALREREEQYRELFENANDLIFTVDLEGYFTSLNRAGEIITGYTREEASKMKTDDLTAPENLKIAEEMMFRKMGGEVSTVYEIDIISKSGKRISFELNTRLIFLDGKPIGIQGIGRDITERKQAEKALINSERRYRLLGEGIMHQVWTAQPDGKIDYVNKRTLDYSGKSFEKMLGDGWQSLVHPEDLAKCVKRWNHSLTTGEDYETEFRLRRRDGEYFWHQARATAGLSSSGKIINWFGTNTDINVQKLAEAKLNHFAGHDTLTNLPNRAKFMNYLERAIARSEYNPSFRFAVLFLDLDRFKIINDSLGHTTGDKLLIALAQRLDECLRPNDIVARLGGDEFTVLLSNINEPADAVRIAKRFLERLSLPFNLDAYEVFTSASIGIIVSDEVKRQPEDFLRDADTAMYRAKEAGKSRYEIFDREMHIRNINLLQMENDLRKAIERNEFKVFYQPILKLETGEIHEFEALIRWHHPQHGLVMPNDFINIAEETGLIIQIGRWILEESCRQTVEWQKQFPLHKNLSISVNLSAKQLMHPDLTGQVSAVLTKTALKSRFLKLEVTESMVIENGDKALSVISDLNKLGISFSTDDFGTGYSSLSYLHRFPFSRLKIDRSFVSKMDTDQKSEAIVRTILLLAQNLDIEVVAEGIETEAQLCSLSQLGCKTGQGYFFSKPITADAAALLLQNGLPNLSSASFYNFSETENHQLLELDKVQ